MVVWAGFVAGQEIALGQVVAEAWEKNTPLIVDPDNRQFAENISSPFVESKLPVEGNTPLCAEESAPWVVAVHSLLAEVNNPYSVVHHQTAPGTSG